MKINSLLFLFLLTVSCSQPENRIDLTGKETDPGGKISGRACKTGRGEQNEG